MAGTEGFEPSTQRLTAVCSANGAMPPYAVRWKQPQTPLLRLSYKRFGILKGFRIALIRYTGYQCDIPHNHLVKGLQCRHRCLEHVHLILCCWKLVIKIVVPWVRRWDSNPRPSAYEADELPTATTPQYIFKLSVRRTSCIPDWFFTESTVKVMS